MTELFTSKIELATSAPVKNILDAAKQYKLTKWLDTNKETFKDMTQAQIAVLAAENLGFTVTVANVYGACNAIGIKLGQRIARAHNGAAVPKDINRMLAKHIVYLYENLREPVPESLFNLAYR